MLNKLLVALFVVGLAFSAACSSGGDVKADEAPVEQAVEVVEEEVEAVEEEVEAAEEEAEVEAADEDELAVSDDVDADEE